MVGNDQPVFKEHLTVGRLIHAGYAVEGCRLACAVWADQCNDLTLVNFKGQIVNGNDTAELHGYIVQPKNVFSHCRSPPQLQTLSCSVWTSGRTDL